WAGWRPPDPHPGGCPGPDLPLFLRAAPQGWGGRGFTLNPRQVIDCGLFQCRISTQMSQTETTDSTSTTEPAGFAMASVPGMPFATTTGLRVRPDLYDEDYSDDQYEQMLELYEGTMSQIAEGEIVKSKVLRVTDNAVILDVGFKSEGSVPLDEFKDPQNLQVGDEVEVFLEHLEDQEGAVVLSKKKADFMRVWEKIRQAHEN